MITQFPHDATESCGSGEIPVIRCIVKMRLQIIKTVCLMFLFVVPAFAQDDITTQNGGSAQSGACKVIVFPKKKGKKRIGNTRCVASPQRKHTPGTTSGLSRNSSTVAIIYILVLARAVSHKILRNTRHFVIITYEY